MPTIHQTSQSIELPHETVRLPLPFFHVLFVFQAWAIIHNMLHEDSGYLLKPIFDPEKGAKICFAAGRLAVRGRMR